MVVLLLGGVCCEGWGRPLFIAQEGRFPLELNMETLDTAFGRIRTIFPPKMMPNGAGRPCGLAGPWVPLLVPPFILDTAWWAPNLCMSVPGLCTSVFYVKWAHLASVTYDEIFCGFICVFFVFSSYFWLVSLQSKNHQNSWNSLVIIPTTTVDVHSSCLYAGVDDINFTVKDHQQIPPHLIFARLE